MTGLAQQHKRHLRKLAHNLRPVIIVGAAGLSDPVLAEIDVAMRTHELIKLRLNTPDREARRDMVEQVITHTGADLVQAIGHVVVLFRQRPTDPKIALPALRGS